LHYKIVMGDFNAKVEAKLSSDTKVGNFGFGKRNERGEKLLEFSEANRLFISNIFFRKPPQRKWTWKGPNETKNEIDYVLSNNRAILHAVSVLNSFKVSSDRRMLRCKMKLNTRLERKNLRGKPPLLDLENLGKNRHIFEIELSNSFSALEELEDEEDINSRNKILTEIIRETAKEIAGTGKKRESKISE